MRWGIKNGSVARKETYLCLEKKLHATMKECFGYVINLVPNL
jgi:hypothetical protein